MDYMKANNQRRLSVIRLEMPDDNGYSSQYSSPPDASQGNHRAHEADLSQRQLSILDPFSDRVSTILVWKNLSVFTREDKKKELFQRMKVWKKFEPKRQCLLNNISGAITGGLWAVMGQFSRPE